MIRLCALGLLLTSLTLPANCIEYTIRDTYVGEGFLSGFTHQAISDPTHGRVQYVTEKTALRQNLTSFSADTLILRADSETVLSPAGPGRKSVRIQSKKQYTTGVTIFNVRHMPVGCGTWPAFWTTGVLDWPNVGEIDILEGVNDVGPNRVTLHTSPGCSMSPGKMIQSGNLVAPDCNWLVDSNTGCSVATKKKNSYGYDLNAVGGGWFAMERTSSHISVWFWPRNAKVVPPEIVDASESIDPSTWGMPIANFVDNDCDLNEKFGPHNIIINLTFCGDWAGNAYPGSCPKNCIDHVNSDPEAFADAYWDIAGLYIYG